MSLLQVAVMQVVASAKQDVVMPPVFYEANVGQTSSEVRFVGRTRHFNIGLLDSGARVRFHNGDEFHLQWAGSAPNVVPRGEWQTGGRSHYINTNEYTNTLVARHYGRIRYASVYTGIDAVIYSRDGRPAFDFVVAPMANPRLIQLHIDGADTLRISSSGEAVIVLRNHTFVLSTPLLYQPCPRGLCTISGQFVQITHNTLAFRIGDYDHSLPLVIDPQLSASYIGGSQVDIISAVATDTAGNIYVTGYTRSASFPTTTTPAPPHKAALLAGDADAFVIKFNSTMQTVLYATFVGGPFEDYARAIAVNGAGAVYLTGSTVGRFPVTAASFRTQPAAAPAVFVAKLSPDGSTLEYATYLDGAGSGQAIAVDSSDQAYVAGWTYTATFFTTNGAFQGQYSGNKDAFIVKLNSLGTLASYSTFLGGSEEDRAMAIALPSGTQDVVVAGFTSSSNFPTTPGAYDRSYNGESDAFVARVNTITGALVYSTYLGAPGADRAYAVALDSSMRVYVAGETTSSLFPTSAGAYQPALAGLSDGFVTKLQLSGTGLSDLVYSTYVGGTAACSVDDGFRQYICDGAHAIAVDALGQAYVTGIAGSGIPSGSAPGGNGDAFMVQLGAEGRGLLSAMYLGGAGGDVGLGLAMGPNGSAVVGGVTASTNLPSTSGSLYPSAAGLLDGFLGRLTDCPATFVSPGSFFPGSGATYPGIGVSASANCNWIAFSNVPWASVSAGGTGNGTFALTLTPNTCQAGRNGILTLPGGSSYTINQTQGTCFQFEPQVSWFPATSGTYSIQLVSSDSASWSATSIVSWLTLSGQASGVGSATLTITLAANTAGPLRIGGILVSKSDLSTASFIVRQLAPAP